MDEIVLDGITKNIKDGGNGVVFIPDRDPIFYKDGLISRIGKGKVRYTLDGEVIAFNGHIRPWWAKGKLFDLWYARAGKR